MSTLEASYHSTCYAAYLKSPYTKTSTHPRDEAFEKFTTYLSSFLKEERAVSMDMLMEKYSSLLIEEGLAKNVAENYQSKRLKKKDAQILRQWNMFS